MIEDNKNQLKNPDELTVKEIKEINQFVKDINIKIKNTKKEIRLISINCNILWKNELKINKVLGYDLEG